MEHISFLCDVLVQAFAHKRAFENKKQSFSTRMKEYLFLRRRGLIKHDSLFLESLKSEFLEKSKTP